MSNQEAILAAARAVIDPHIGRSLGDLNAVKGVEERDGVPQLVVELPVPTPAYSQIDELSNGIRSAVRASVSDVGDLNIQYPWKVCGRESGGSIGLKVKNVIAVGSGKGGVGKSTVAACLAYGLQSFGASVGLMDADVYGPSIPHMLNAKGQPAALEKTDGEGNKLMRMQPIEVDGIKLMSMGFFVDEGKAVVWRGPMLHKALTQFLKDTEWGELDYLVIDLPPGTGDVSLTLSQLVGLAGAVIVCTPQQVALLDAVKAIDMYSTVKVPVLGVVENMSGEVFGRGGAKKMAEVASVPFLGEVPMEAAIRIKSDEGAIAGLFAEDNPAREPLQNMCSKTALSVARQLLENPAPPTLEIL